MIQQEYADLVARLLVGRLTEQEEAKYSLAGVAFEAMSREATGESLLPEGEDYQPFRSNPPEAMPIPFAIAIGITQLYRGSKDATGIDN